MRFLHISDLHLGKRVNEFSMLPEQAYILTQILDVMDDKNAEAVIIAGDIYDKAVPSAEAVQLFDSFLTRLADKGKPVFVISGNHDSPERIAFGAQLVSSRGVYFSPVFCGCEKPIILNDKYGEIAVHMLPFVKPAAVRHVYKDDADKIITYNDAVKTAISHMQIDKARRSVLVAHQFVTGAARCESEDISVGGVDNVDYNVFDAFDYVALGHIHGAQHVGRETVCYCGTPLKYSFSEAKHKKCALIVDINAKGDINFDRVPLTPQNDLREVKGTYMQLTARENYKGTNTNDYMHITLTDEDDIPAALDKLRAIYPNIMKLDYDNARTRTANKIEGAASENKTPIELINEFYTLQNNVPLSEGQTKLANGIIEKIWEGEA